MAQIFNNKYMLGFSILLLCFLYTAEVNAQTISTQQRVYIKIGIKGMACPYCAFGMEKELKKVVGVENVDIELKEGLAYISLPTEQKPTKESLEKIIVEAGFTVDEIVFSDKPFKRTETKNKK